MLKKTKLWRGLAACLCFLLALILCVTALAFDNPGVVNMLLGISSGGSSGSEITSETMYYKTSFSEDGTLSEDSFRKLIEAEDAHNTQVMEEGAVLVKNENSALPLKEEERSVTLFGRAVADPVYRCSTAGPDLDPERLIDLKTALEEKGFKINATLYNAYAASATKRDMRSRNIGEENISFHTQSLRDSYATDYNDVAIVMLSRYAGEGNDLAVTDADGVPQLSLHQQEKDLLKMIHDSGKFKKTIVLINSGYAMEMEWVNDAQYGIDACLWIGNPGLTGFTGVANVLTGEASPTGRFVDTYATNSLSSPAMRNFGDFRYTNESEIAAYCSQNGGGTSYSAYVVEAEGIYIGYKYYETRYQDQVLGINNAANSAGAFVNTQSWDYAAEITYPFGYGLSYAEFSQTLDELVWDQTAHTVTATVTVTNVNAENAGYTDPVKSVVQLYVQLPYEKGQAQKSAIQLIGFAKTDALAPGESDTVTITVDDYLFATYDENAVNGADQTKKGCYVFDAGKYCFAIGDNCHDALNNVMASNGYSGMFDQEGNVVAGDPEKVVAVEAEYDNNTYAKSRETGAVVSNSVEDVNLNYFQPGTVEYMTRDDWTTYPKSYDNIAATQEMMVQLNGHTYTKPADAPAVDDFVQEKPAGISVVDLREVSWDDDETWERFLNQLSIADLCQITTTYWGGKSISSVNKPPHVDGDGPDGYASEYDFGSKGDCTVYVNQCVLACTWNQELAAERGDLLAEDALYAGVHQLWAPGANLHRTPYSGRNFEYYSEDSIVSYIYCGVQTKAMQDKGLMASPKHFAANDQETNRGGISTFMTEQALRQGPLKGFEGAFTVGGALATMTSMNRIGCTAMTQNSKVQNTILRGEWGFKGVCIADASSEGYNHSIESLVNGTDQFCLSNDRYKAYISAINGDKDGYILQCIREANKRFYYAYARTSIINGLTSNSVVEDTVYWWEPTLTALCWVVGVLAAGSIAMFVCSAYVCKKDKREA